MMNKKLLLLLLIAGIAVIFVSTGLQAGTDAKDVMTLADPGYKKPKKRAPKFKEVQFSHKKHSVDYKLDCGECHHDKDHKPLTADQLKAGDANHKCSECHNKFKKNKKNKKDILVHENAMHENCRGCHKEVNIKAGDPKGRKGPAPTSCGKCHEKA